MFHRLKSTLLLATTFFLLYLVLRKVGLADLIETLRGADVYWLLLSLAISPLTVLVSVIKWQVLLKSQDANVALPRLYALYLIGRFFNNFLPSTVGGDVVRGYELGNYTRDKAGAMASVVMERLTGLVMLVIMALLSFFTHLRLTNDIRLTVAMALVVLGLIALLWLVLDARPLNFALRWMQFPFAKKYAPKIQKFHTSLSAYRHNRRVLGAAMLWSLAFMVVAILNVYISARAFHNTVSLFEIAIIVPVILVVAMLPFTFNGLGLQEWAYVLLFTWIGLPASVGLSTIVLIRGKELIFASLGGILYPALKLTKDSVTSYNEPDTVILKVEEKQ